MFPAAGAVTGPGEGFGIKVVRIRLGKATPRARTPSDPAQIVPNCRTCNHAGPGAWARAGLVWQPQVHPGPAPPSPAWSVRLIKRPAEYAQVSR